MIPDIVCIGAQKAGTTWLHTMLTTRPDVRRGPLKEYHYFSYRFAREPWMKGAVLNQLNAEIKKIEALGPDIPTWRQDRLSILRALSNPERVFTAEWYQLAMSAPQNITKCDFSPSYELMPEEGISRLYAELGNVPIIFLIRDPLSREISSLKMRLTRRCAAAGLSPDHADDQMWINTAKQSTLRGAYSISIPRWERNVPTRLMGYFGFGRIKNQPDQLLADIEKHTGLSPHSYAKPDRQVFPGPDIKVPKAALDILKRRADKERAFLSRHLGDEFLASTS